MARFYGQVGYGVSTEEPLNSGVWIPVITERIYQGDIVRNVSQQIVGQDSNDNVSLSNSISIVADDFAFENFLTIKYVKWAGVLWTVTSVEVQRPRLILSLGRDYNGPTA